ncbi:MAG: lytic transglycosylase domain-containing protein [Pseudolabrys sp.]
MRHLFVPACVCVMTWSGATADMKLALDEFPPTAAKAESKAFGEAAPVETGSAEPVHVDIPINVNAADIAREAPVQDTAQKTARGAQPQFAESESIPLPPVAKPVVHRTHREICDTLTEAAQSNNLPVPFFIRLLFQESGFEPGIVSTAGAQGIAQFMPDTAADMGVKNPFDPLQAIPASARLLRNLVSQFGNLGLAAAAYNAGPKRIQDWLGKKGKLPEETQGYVKTITGRPAETWTASEGYSGQRIPRHAPCQDAAACMPRTDRRRSRCPRRRRERSMTSHRPRPSEWWLRPRRR